MDYEKKYKDALERAKRWADGTLMPPDDSPKTVAVVIFPELAESEDERALRIIKKRMCYDTVPISDEDRRIVEAWLEKQKEPQNKSMAHEDSSWSGILTSPLCKDKNLDDIAQEYVEGVKEYNPTPDWNLIHTAVCYGYHLGKQKEQKPESITSDVKEYIIREDYTSAYYEERGYKNGYADGVRDTKAAIAKSPVEQKPVEWSEEDEEHLKWLCRIIHSRKVHGELSLEEESELGKWMDKWLNHNPVSRWKPSEEQMKALSETITFMPDTFRPKCTLATLQNDLKKHM